MTPQPQITILPKDKPSAGVCSRCSDTLDARYCIVEWNGVRFAYCSTCQTKGAM